MIDSSSSLVMLIALTVIITSSICAFLSDLIKPAENRSHQNKSHKWQKIIIADWCYVWVKTNHFAENSRFWFSHSISRCQWEALHHVRNTKLHFPVSYSLILYCSSPLCFKMCHFDCREVINQEAHGLESDIWSVGCMLYAMLTGRPPFEAQGIEDTFDRVRLGEYEVPRDLSADAKSLIGMLLQRNPMDRLKLQSWTTFFLNFHQIKL